MPDAECRVTAEECKAVVAETGVKRLGHHRCGGCGAMVAYVFEIACNVYIDPGKEGLRANDMVVGFDANCDCGRAVPVTVQSWNEFADTFNMQPTADGRARMWDRFKAGKPTHELENVNN
jgi:hypothetical protein